MTTATTKGHAHHTGRNRPGDLLIALRAGDATARAAALATDADGASLRAALVPVLAARLVPGDRPLVRDLLRAEVATIRTDGSDVSDALYTLVAALARFAQPADVPEIWRARAATPETRAGVDVEQALRAGPDAVLTHLRTLAAGDGPDARDAADALAWVGAGIAEGAAGDLPGYFAWSDERYGVGASGPT